uniref:Uncharacterized protein n=1 Tax=Noccaea caerulescens TaxID=107243 RepID=A0A1J3IH76_NOCCA
MDKSKRFTVLCHCPMILLLILSLFHSHGISRVEKKENLCFISRLNEIGFSLSPSLGCHHLALLWLRLGSQKTQSIKSVFFLTHCSAMASVRE